MLGETMSYTIQAIIANDAIKQRVAELQLHFVDMPYSMLMIPLTFDYANENDIPFLPITDEGSASIGEKLIDLCLDLSKHCKVAYIEAEFFGGEGTQACNLYENGIEVEMPMISTSAINYALQWLGVKCDKGMDEFETFGLDAHRNTEYW
jgi:hypothetical protein